MNMVQPLAVACHRGDERRAAAFGRSLERIVQDEVVIAAAVSEPHQDLTRPRRARLATAPGWVLNGRKIFCTMSPAATMSAGVGDVRRTRGASRCTATWRCRPNARASPFTTTGTRSACAPRAATRSVSMTCTCRSRRCVVAFPVGRRAGYIETKSRQWFVPRVGIGGHRGSSAVDVLLARLQETGERDVERPEQMLTAENAIELSAMRATFGRAAQLVDTFQTRSRRRSDGQRMDHDVRRGAGRQDVRRRSRGAHRRPRADAVRRRGYMRSHPLSRAYRDVRAGSFMQPLWFTRAHEFISRAALNLEPRFELLALRLGLRGAGRRISAAAVGPHEFWAAGSICLSGRWPGQRSL